MSLDSGLEAQGTDGWRTEIGSLAALAWPLVLGNLAQIAMSATDVIMMGRLGASTMAAGALGANLYFVALVAGIGLLNAAAPLMGRALGRADADAASDVALTVRQSLLAAALLAVPSWVVLWWSEALLLGLGQEPALAAEAGTYVRSLQWALLPFWAFLVLRSFISALQRPLAALVVGIVGIVINALGNWCLMLGQCGMAPLGIAGSGVSTSVSALVMLVALGATLAIDRRFRDFPVFSGPWRLDRSRLAALWALGLPMGAMLVFEVSVFNAAVFLMGLFGTTALAAHAIAIQIASLTFMVPLGIGQAATVRVALAYGRDDAVGVTRAGWTAFWMAIAFMALSAIVMLAAPRLLISAFLDVGDPANTAVVQLATTFLFLAAVFQIADGAQAVGGGMLRGLHDARVPMIYALVGYWGIGMPLGAGLAFGAGLGGAGIWIGLAVGLATVAILVIHRWMGRVRLGLIRSPA